jgi:hypothetical protein
MISSNMGVHVLLGRQGRARLALAGVAASCAARLPLPPSTAVEGAAVMCVLDAARRSDAVGGDTTAVEGDRTRRVATR